MEEETKNGAIPGSNQDAGPSYFSERASN